MGPVQTQRTHSWQTRLTVDFAENFWELRSLDSTLNLARRSGLQLSLDTLKEMPWLPGLAGGDDSVEDVGDSADDGVEQVSNVRAHGFIPS